MPALLLIERNLLIYRHTWYLLLAEVLEPMLYLLTIGVGIGQLVGHVPGLGGTGSGGGGIGYSVYVAPALLATAAMNGAMNETTFNMFAKLKLQRVYDSILATPMTVYDVAVGEVCWALLRGVLITAGFLAVVGAFGLVHSAWILLVVPGAALVGFAFASVGLAVVTCLRTWADFQFIQLAMLPMFLFATTFYPLSVYPRPIQIAVECLPLYQSIQLIRLPALGHPGTALLLPVVYLLLMGALGLRIALPRMQKLLLR
ncbi:ABC transporter permease [Streptacidiphilus sp. EB103A]|uniref:ABC transporter permease n=1 Tax=Streptacidiphilus sp. EB103A TaxID=3156275 RepID=UPI003514ABD8